MADRIPRVIVVGVTMPQFRILVAAVGDSGKELIFWDRDKKNIRLPDADYCIVWVKFVKHTVSRKVATGFPGRYWFHHLGMKELIELVKGLKF